MAPPIWTLVLLVGAACAQGHMPAPILKEKPPDQKLEALIPNGSTIITQCDFEDDIKPLCGWSQGSRDDGDWTRDKMSFPRSDIGPPGGYPSGDGYYLHMLSSTFPRRGVARLRSPPIWEQGPLCLHFVYRLFGLSWGAQLRLLLLQARGRDQNQHPNTLWKHLNSQSPSWTPTTVSVPAVEFNLTASNLSLPRRLVFEGMLGSTSYLDIALDSISLHRGSCNQVCELQLCSFDMLNDFCGWSWISTVSGAKWVQKKGSSGMPNVGPEDDFSKPGGGFYMLLDPTNAKGGQKSTLVSPETQSSGCLSLSFHYTLRGSSPGAALSVYAQAVGSIRKHTLFSGQPAAGWQPVSVNYTGQGALQFIIVGMFGKEPEPAVAVDEISIVPCGETLPRCDFEDDDHPFCDWSQVAESGGEWTRGSRTSPRTSSIGNSLKNGTHFIYLASNKFSQEGQNFRLLSRPFCAPATICVEFSYSMFGLGNGTTLKLLLGSPVGSRPKSLWCQQGSQKPDWLKTSITVPSGLPQPMQLILSAVGGSNVAFIVAVGFIGINHGACREPAATVPPSQSPDTCEPPGPTELFTGTLDTFTVSYTATWSTEQITDLTETTVGPTGKPTVSSGEQNIECQEFTSPSKEFTVPPEKFISPPKVETNLPIEISISLGQTTLLKEQPTALFKESTVPPEKQNTPTEPTEKPTMPTEEPIFPTEKTTIPTEKSTVPTKTCTVPTEKPIIPTEKPTVPTETSTVTTKEITEKTTLSTEKLTIATKKPTIPTERPTTIPTEKLTIPTEKPAVITEKPAVTTEKPTVPTEKPTVPTKKPTVPTEKPTFTTEKRTFPTEKCTVPTEKPTVPNEKPTDPTEKPTDPTEKPTDPTEKPTNPTEKPTVPTKKPTDPTKKNIDPTEKPIIPTKKPTDPTEKNTDPTKKPTDPTEKPTDPTEKPTDSTKKPTGPTEKTIDPTEKPTDPTKKPTDPTEKPTDPIEKTTDPTEKPTDPTKKNTVPTKKTTDPTDKITGPTKKPTDCTKKPTDLTEKNIVPTEKPTDPTKKPIDPTNTSTIHTEAPTIHTEAPTVHTEKLTVPTEKPTVPTQKLTLPIQSSMKSTILVAPPKALSTFPITTTHQTTRAQHPEICPANAHFERCGCLASCSNPRPSCGSHCVSGCVCNSGYLFSNNSCTEASSCSCFYNNNYYKVGDTWFSSNCSERCRCLPGSHTRCHMAHCGTNSVCQLKNGQYGCHPYGSAICSVYGDTNYLTFDGRHFRFMGKCTYVLAQSCGNLTEPFFRVTAKNEGRGQEGMSCVSKVYVTLHEIAVTLLKDRRVLVGGQLATLPANPSSGVFLFPSGRFVELQTPFGVWLRWDGDQQLYLSVPSAYAGKLCGFCGNYDGDESNDKQKPDGKMAADEEELGRSWRTAEDEDKECQKGHVSPPSCNLALLSRLSGPKMCGLLVEERGPFSACLPHVPVTTFFRNCLFDMCNFQGMQQMLCTHLAALTETCQEAGLAVKPWRGPEFCPLSCPAFSKYTLCGKSCPGICHSNFSGVSCRDRCAEGCQCDPGYVLSGLQCVHAGQCGCLDPTRGYFKVGEQWYKPGCRQLCVCEAKQDIRCFPAKCSEREVCNLQEGKYGCHPQGYGVCTISGDSHIQTFDGALSHFLGTCTYVLTKPCSARVFESHFVVSASSEFRLGNQDTTFVSAVHVEVYKVKISMLKGSRVVLNGQRVLPPLRLLQGRLLVRLSGVFLRLSTDFGLQVRYDGNHLVEVKVPSTYAHRLCGLCGNYNNKTLDDNELVDRNHPWKIREASEAGCYTTIKSQSCVKKESLEPWENNCSILLNPQGPFSQCHQVVSPNASFFSCMTSQCVSKGSPLALCRSLQAYATLCASAGQALSWRNSSVCPLPCPSGSNYSPCANPCPATCLDMFSPTDCGPALPCTEGCECQEGYILSGTSCVPLSQCGCTQGPDAYHAVGESWYSDETCSKLCSCSASNNASCHQASCGRNQQCWALDGLTRCRSSYVGVCSSVLQEHYYYVSFDGTQHTLGGNCSYILAMSCHYTANTPFFKITSQNGPLEGAACTLTQQIIVQAFDLQITMQKNHRVLINGTQVQLPYKDQGIGFEGEFPKQRFSVTAANDSTQLTLSIGLIVNFKSDGSYLQIQVPGAYYKKVCGICGNYNGEQEDELMMPSDELAQSDVEFVTSWQDKEFSLNCPSDAQKAQTEPTPQPESSCWQADLSQAQEQCQAAFQSPAWVSCSAHVSLEPYLLRCVHSLCRFGGLNQALCESLQAFEAACQAQGFKPHIWRNSSFCPLECPAHSSYTTCMGPCVPACGKAKCSTQPQPEAGCREGCVCQPGFLLSKKLCVPESHCSCTNPEGRPLPGGQMWVSKDCAQSCMCTVGTLRCEPFSCPFGSHCQPIPEEGGSCKPDRSQLCSVFGDSHYLTFDGLLYTFPGRMTYTLLRTVSKLPRGLEPLVVEGRNHASNRSPDPKSVYTLQEVTVRIQGHVIQMQSNLRLVVNNQRMTVPFSPSKYLQVSLRGHRMYLVTSFELVVSFDGKDNAVISLPTTYQGLVQGLCGNFDKDKWNDFTTPSGTPVQDASVFGSSWEVKTNPRGLRRLSRAVREEDEGPAPCSGEQRALSNSSHACGVLLDPQGPFAACHRVVAPEPFQEHCVLALCAHREPGLHEELRCRLLGGYASTCQEAGSTLGGWREHTRCALACPANTIYRSCMSPCPASCASLGAPGACTGPCVEGCASLPGFAYSGAQSLPHSHCGCTRDGRYYQGESVVSEDCSQRCTCARPGLLLCRPLHCGPGETCTLGNLTRGCFRESPCLQNPCQNDGRCVERGNRFVCECEPGYGGDLCSEPGDRPRPPEPDTSSLVPIGLGTLVLMTALALAQLCASRTRRKRMQNWFRVSPRTVLSGAPKRHQENKIYF